WAAPQHLEWALSGPSLPKPTAAAWSPALLALQILDAADLLRAEKRRGGRSACTSAPCLGVRTELLKVPRAPPRRVQSSSFSTRRWTAPRRIAPKGGFPRATPLPSSSPLAVSQIPLGGGK
ncbi:hypothetical protein EI555_013575, partial [Monodon monoceros]